MKISEDQLIEYLERNNYSKTSFTINDLLKTNQMQRLKGIEYLGSIRFIYKLKDSYSRWDHSINVAYLIASILINNNIEEKYGYEPIINALLHDIGHPCFSHVAESALGYAKEVNHKLMGDKIVFSSEISNIRHKYYNDFETIMSESISLNILLNSHLDIDTLEGISNSAEIIGLNYIDWFEILPKAFVIKENKFYWKNEYLEKLELFWKLKQEIYNKYVYSPENLVVEAMLGKIIRILVNKNVFITDSEIINLCQSNKETHQIYNDILEKKYYLKIDLKNVIPPEKTSEIYPGYSEWFELLEKEIISFSGLSKNDFIISLIWQKQFEKPNLKEKYRDRIENGVIKYEELNDIFDSFYSITVKVLLFIRNDVPDDVFEKLKTFHPKFVLYHNIEVLIGQSKILREWEKYIRSPTIKLSEYTSGVVIHKGKVIALNVQFNLYNNNDIDLSMIGDLVDLDELIVGNCKLIPKEIQKLTKLRRLTIKHIYFEVSPEYLESIFHLQSLEFLEIEDTKLKILSENIANLSNLKELKIKAPLESIPNSITLLSKLEKFKLEHPDSYYRKKVDKIFALPDSFDNLFYLKEIKIKGFNIIEFPESITKCVNLKTIELKGTNIKNFPESIGNLSYLEKISIEDNTIESFPNVFRRLKKIKSIELNTPNLKEIPDSILFVDFFNNISIRSNVFTDFPVYFANSFGNSSLSRQYFHFQFDQPLNIPYSNKWSANILKSLQFNKAKRLDPQLLCHPNPQVRDTFNGIFFRSTNLINNFDDFIQAFIKNTDFFQPYLIKLGTKIVPHLKDFIKTKVKSGNINRLQKLVNIIEDIEVKSKIGIQFISIIPREGSQTYPLGVLTLAAYLKKNNFLNISYAEFYVNQEQNRNSIWFDETRDNNSLFSEENLCNKKVDFQIVLIGPIFTCYLPKLIYLVQRLKKVNNKLIVLAGGHHFGKNNDMDKELLQMLPELDAIIVGEAEETLPEFLITLFDKKIKNHDNYSNIFTDIDGLLVKKLEFRERKPIKDLSFVPLPDLDLLEGGNLDLPQGINNYYQFHLSDRRNPVIKTVEGVVGEGQYSGVSQDDLHLFEKPFQFKTVYNDKRIRFDFGIIMGSRGCPYHCSFCASHDDRRLRSSESMLKELKWLYEKYGISLFVFFDPLFTTKAPNEKRRIRDLCNGILANNLNINFEVELRADVINQLPEELIELILLSGCSAINLGLEKGSDKALEMIDKGMKREDHYIAIDIIRNISSKINRNVLINGTFIFGGPDEEWQDILDTITHAFSLDLDGLALFPLEIHPGTKDYETAIDIGVLEPGIKPYLKEGGFKNYPHFVSKTITLEDLLKLDDKVRVIIQDIKVVQKEMNLLLTENNACFEFLMKDKLSNYRNYYADYNLNKIKDKLANEYTQEFLRNLKKSIVCNDKIKIKEIYELTEYLEEKLNEFRPKNYDYRTGDYFIGYLPSSIRNFVEAFNDLRNWLVEQIKKTR